MVRTVARSIGIALVAGLPVSALSPAAVPSPSVTVIAHASTPALTEEVLRKIYEGKVVQVDGHPVIPVNLKEGTPVRKEFMERVLAQDDARFVAYWTVRRYIGKGSPPKEFGSVEEQVNYIRNTPGAIGYVDASVNVEPGLKALIKKP